MVAFAGAQAFLARRALADLLDRVPPRVFAFGYGAAVALVFPSAAAGDRPFIYFQF